MEGKKFVCLAYGDEKNWNALSKIEQNAKIDECMAYGESVRDRCALLGGEALQSATTAKTLCFRAGKVMITDGPYAETKEQVGGAAIFDARIWIKPLSVVEPSVPSNGRFVRNSARR